MKDEKDRQGGESNVVELANFRKKKDVTEELTRGGRNPLFVSHSTGKVTGNPHLKGPQSPDFGDRLQRIRSSLEKINRLMSDLKRMSSEAEAPGANSTTQSKH